MKKQIIQTDDAPQAIGTYSQAVRVSTGDTVYVSGQIPLDPTTMQMVTWDRVSDPAGVLEFKGSNNG